MTHSTLVVAEKVRLAHRGKSSPCPKRDWLKTRCQKVCFNIQLRAVEPIGQTIIYYESESGDCPAFQWLESMKDKKTRIIIKARIRRLEEGIFGHTRNLGDGVTELKIDYGPGYRVYLGHVDRELIVILVVGDKSTQSKDIKTAKQRWKHFLERKK